MNINSYIIGSTKYHDSVETDAVRYFCESASEFDNEFKNLEFIAEKVALENEMYGYSDTSSYYQESVMEMITHLGDKILEIGRKIQEFIQDCIDKIKSIGFNRKNDMEKLEKLARKYPNAKINIYDAYANGLLKPSDMKSINELEKTYETLNRMCDDDHTDAGRIKSMWNKALKKFDKDTDHWDLEKTLKIVAATISVSAGLIKLKKDYADYQKNMSYEKRHQAKLTQDAYNAMKRASNAHKVNGSGEPALDPDTMGKLQLKYHLACQMKGKVTAQYSKQRTLMQRVMDKFLSTADSKLDSLDSKVNKTLANKNLIDSDKEGRSISFRNNITRVGDTVNTLYGAAKGKPVDSNHGQGGTGGNGTNGGTK